MREIGIKWYKIRIEGENMNDRRRKMISIILVVLLSISMVLGVAAAGLSAFL
jgi:hypothetical protein